MFLRLSGREFRDLNTSPVSRFLLPYYASEVYAVVVCPSVRPSVRLSHADIVPKRLNLESRKQRRTIAQGLQFLTKNFPRNSNGVVPNGGTK